MTAPIDKLTPEELDTILREQHGSGGRAAHDDKRIEAKRHHGKYRPLKVYEEWGF